MSLWNVFPKILVGHFPGKKSQVQATVVGQSHSKCFESHLARIFGSKGYESHQLLGRNVKRFRGGLVFKARRLLCHSTLGSRVIRKRRRATSCPDIRG